MYENKGNCQDNGNDNQLGDLYSQIKGQQGDEQIIAADEAEQGIGERETVDEAEKQGKEVDEGQPRRMFHLAGSLQQVVKGSRQDGQRDEELDPARGKMHQPQRAEGEGGGMADGKGGHQHDDLSPIPDQITQAEGSHE